MGYDCLSQSFPCYFRKGWRVPVARFDDFPQRGKRFIDHAELRAIRKLFGRIGICRFAIQAENWFAIFLGYGNSSTVSPGNCSECAWTKFSHEYLSPVLIVILEILQTADWTVWTAEVFLTLEILVFSYRLTFINLSASLNFYLYPSFDNTFSPILMWEESWRKIRVRFVNFYRFLNRVLLWVKVK